MLNHLKGMNSTHSNSYQKRKSVINAFLLEMTCLWAYTATSMDLDRIYVFICIICPNIILAWFPA